MAQYKDRIGDDPDMAESIPSIEKDIETAKKLLRRYPNWEKKFDWNRILETTPWQLHSIVMDMKEQEARNRTRKTKSKALKDYSPSGLFADVEGRRFNFLGDIKGWVAVQPLNWEAAVWCADYLVGGVPGKWCISNSHHPDDWNMYGTDGSRFVFLLKKNANPKTETNIKCMVEYNQCTSGNRPTIWTEVDHEIHPNCWGDDGTYESWIASQLYPVTLEDLMGFEGMLQEPDYEPVSDDEDEEEPEVEAPPEHHSMLYGPENEWGII